jgi:hypothetical protein
VKLLVLVLLTGCLRPAPLGISRVQVCGYAEAPQRPDGPPKAGRSASVCVDFERAADAPAE